MQFKKKPSQSEFKKEIYELGSGADINDYFKVQPDVAPDVSLTLDKLKESILRSSMVPNEAIDIGRVTTSSGSYSAVKEDSELALMNMLQKLPSETVIRALLKKNGRWIKDMQVKDVLEYMTRKSHTMFTDYESVDDLVVDDGEDGLVHLKNMLEQLPGVKVMILANEYPESASIILKFNATKLDEKEVEEVPGQITDTIADYKPKGLQDLEVIYHNKEVY